MNPNYQFIKIYVVPCFINLVTAANFPIQHLAIDDGLLQKFGTPNLRMALLLFFLFYRSNALVPEKGPWIMELNDPDIQVSKSFIFDQADMEPN